MSFFSIYNLIKVMIQKQLNIAQWPHVYSLALCMVMTFCFIHVIDSSVVQASLPVNSLWLNAWQINELDEAEFNQVIEQMKVIIEPMIMQRGGSLHVIQDWSDGAVNAFAWREGPRYYLEILGGMARHQLVTADAFVLVVCHELGHLMGGYPARREISAEGQADYFATSKCFRWLAPQLKVGGQRLNTPEAAKVEFQCDKNFMNIDEQKICVRAGHASQSLASLYAMLGNESTPSVLAKDPAVVSVTDFKHPSSQCRLDTLLAASDCPVSDQQEIPLSQATEGVCHASYKSEYARPACWFAQ